MAEQSNPGQRALLIGIAAALVGAGLGAYVQFGMDSQNPDTSISGSTVKTAALTEQAAQIKNFLSKNRELQDISPKGQMIGDKPRVTPVLFPPELWQVTLDASKENRVIDIYDPAAANIHAPIPNLWFIQNGLANELGRADGAIIDSDNDGFTNREEFDASTNPCDANSYPLLVAANKAPKLVVKHVNTTNAVVTAENMLAYATTEPNEVRINIFAKAGDQTPIEKMTLKKGDKFGVSKRSPERFTVVGFETREYVDLSGSASPEMTLKLSDSTAPEGAQEFVIRAGKPPLNDKNKGTPNEKGRHVKDVFVVFEVTAGSKVGSDEATFIVPLSQAFAIPGDEKTRYTIESIDSNGSVNICEQGKKGASINIPKVLVNKKTQEDKEK